MKKSYLTLFLVFVIVFKLNGQVMGENDLSFNIGTGTNTSVEASAIQSDGKILIGGQFITYNGISRNRITRLNMDGTLDTSFIVGTGANGAVRAISIQSDGKVVIGGWFTVYNGISRNFIARLNIDGTLDTFFNMGIGPNDAVETISIQPDGKIIIGGQFTTYNGISRNRIARLNVDGTLDTTFIVGAGASFTIETTAIQSDGKIIIGGIFGGYNGVNISGIARLNSNGSLDSTFNVGLGASDVWSIGIQPDGKIIIGGGFIAYNGVEQHGVARLNSDGILDSSFIVGQGISGNAETVFTISIQVNGQVVIAGDFTTYNGILKNNIVRLNSNGTIDSSFDIGNGANNPIITTTIQADGKIIIGGIFTEYNGVLRNRVARIMNETITGIENINNQSTFNIYPNPTTAEFIIELASFSPKTQLSIVSVEGKMVYTNNTINANKIVINAADWSKGIYMVKITDKQSSQVVKLVKQ